MDTKHTPIVGIIMGSDSDWPTMSPAGKILQDFQVPYEVKVVSAHRMPEDMIAYGREASKKGLRVIIAGAGGAAHLPGMIAAVTQLPVIGVPVALKHLEGMDSLLSIVQMPAGVPVATVGIANATNAGLLALRIIGSAPEESDLLIRAKMAEYQENLREIAIKKGEALAEISAEEKTI